MAVFYPPLEPRLLEQRVLPSTETSDRETARAGSFLSDLWFRLWMVSACAVAAVFAFQSFYPSLIGPLSNVFPAMTAGSAFASALLCLKRYKFSLRRRFEAAWFFFALGMGLWVVAEVTWAVYYFILDVTVPFPSVADLFYVGGYFPIVAGALLYIGVFKVALTPRRLIAALGIFGVAMALAMIFILPIEFTAGRSILLILVDLIYPVLDLSLVAVSAIALAIFYGGKLARWWVLFGFSAILYVVGDELFVYQTSVGTYYNGGVDDLIFLFGYLAFALAFHAHRREF